MALDPDKIYAEAGRFVTHYSSVRTALVASSIALGVGVFGRSLLQSAMHGDVPQTAVNYLFGLAVLGLGVGLNRMFFRLTRGSMRLMSAVGAGDVGKEHEDKDFFKLNKEYAKEEYAKDGLSPPVPWIAWCFFLLFAAAGGAGLAYASCAHGDGARSLPFVMAEGQVAASSTVTIFHNATPDPIRLRVRYFCEKKGTTYHSLDMTGNAGSSEEVSPGSSLHVVRLPAGHSLVVSSEEGCSWQLLEN